MSTQRLRDFFAIEDICSCEAFANQNTHHHSGEIIVKDNETKRTSVGCVVNETNVSVQTRTRSSAQIQMIKPTCNLGIES